MAPSKLVANLKLFFKLFIAPPKRWCMPEKCEVLIYDNDADSLMPYLTNYTVGILALRGESVCIPCLLSAMRSQCFWNGRPVQAYADAYIRSASPTIVITYIDDNTAFYLLKARHPTVKFMSIQNGIRDTAIVFESREQQARNQGYKVDYIMAYGRHYGEQYLKHVTGTDIHIGSLRNNLIPKRQPKIRGTLAFVSQYRETEGYDIDGVFYSFNEFWQQADQIILPYLAAYANANGKAFFIIPGRFKGSITLEKEKAYYNKLLGFDCVYSECQWHGSGYDAIDSAEVVVSIDSTMGLEAAVRGTKSAIFSIRSNILSLPHVLYLKFGCPISYPDDGPFWTNRPDPVAFDRVLDHLFAIDDDAWNAELQQQRISDLLVYDPGNSKLKAILQNELTC